MNQKDQNEGMLVNLVEIAHGLVRTVAALDRTIERLLLATKSTSKDEQLSELETFHRGEPFFKILKWKVAKEELTFEQTTRILEIVLREIDRFRVNIQNYFGSLTRGQQLILRRSPTRLNPILEEVIALFECAGAEKGIEIKRNLQSDVTLRLDSELIYRMLANLLDNAIKYSYFSSEKAGLRFILIESRRHSIHNDWMISFQSYGVGIDQEEIKTRRIFEYGYRGKAASDRGRAGTGIGLAEALRIALAHKGEIEVESRKLEGDTHLTSFKIILPNL
jgi:signal transduction histidine kinase